MMKVNFTETALAEVEQILSHIASYNPAAAVAMRERIERAIGYRAVFPNSAPVTEETGVRQKTVRNSPYLIFYTIEGSEIFVVHVWHGARRKPWEQAI